MHVFSTCWAACPHPMHCRQVAGMAVTSSLLALAVLLSILFMYTVFPSGCHMCWAGQVKQDTVVCYAGVVQLCELSMDARKA